MDCCDILYIDFQGPQWMNPYNFGDPMIFHLPQKAGFTSQLNILTSTRLTGTLCFPDNEPNDF